MIRYLACALAAVSCAIASAVMLVAFVVSASPASGASHARGLPAAVTEDSCASGVARCVWDARHRGNGIGRSFILVRGDVRYVTHQRAHRLVAAWCARPRVDCRY